MEWPPRSPNIIDRDSDFLPWLLEIKICVSSQRGTRSLLNHFPITSGTELVKKFYDRKEIAIWQETLLETWRRVLVCALKRKVIMNVCKISERRVYSVI